MAEPGSSLPARSLAAARWLLSSEPLDEAAPLRDSPPSFLAWLLAPEHLDRDEPAGEPASSPTQGPLAFLRWVLSSDPWPPEE